jgi:hypothetical protein
MTKVKKIQSLGMAQQKKDKARSCARHGYS